MPALTLALTLTQVRKFANQLFVSLQFLARPDVRVIHTDIKVTMGANLRLETLDPEPNVGPGQSPEPRPRSPAPYPWP